MSKTFLLLKSVSDFAPGSFENTTVDNTSVKLSIGGAGFVPLGTYTSVPAALGEFRSLIPSWNADTPPGTSVEVQVRIAAGSVWSRWFGFGRWSPFIDRASPEEVSYGMVFVNAENLSLPEGKKGADIAQIRVHLFTNDAKISPTVNLLSLATDAVQNKHNRKFSSGQRVLELPQYSCLVRDPSVGERMAGATSMAMMINRWGEDVLPEEIARSAYDSGASRFGNLSFLTALAGAYGFESYVSFGGVEVLRNEVWNGFAVAAKVRYRAPMISQNDETNEKEETNENIAPVLEMAQVDSSGHLVVVCGFFKKKNVDYVVISDPLAASDEQVRLDITLSSFAKIYMGQYVVLHRGKKSSGAAKPVRITGSLQLLNDEVHMRVHEKPIEGKDGTETFRNTFCYTLSDGVAYASAAQKKFYYPLLENEGVLKFEQANAEGKKLTCYRVGPLGTTWVAEKIIQTEETASEAGGSNIVHE